MLRIGHGFDLHRLVSGRRLILGGVHVPSDIGCAGHSDADVLIHAIIDAILGALALGDIGKFFPDTDSAFKDIDSRILLRQAYDMVTDRGYTINNIDSTIILETPKLRNYIDTMRANLAEDLGVDIGAVNVKAKTSEGVGIVGKQEAVIAHAVVLLQRT